MSLITEVVSYFLHTLWGALFLIALNSDKWAEVSLSNLCRKQWNWNEKVLLLFLPLYASVLNPQPLLILWKILNMEKLDWKWFVDLFCVSIRFYIGCDLCSNWFHGACVGITEKEAQKLEAFVCNDCKRGQEGTSAEELYCICRTPYDESQYGCF